MSSPNVVPKSPVPTSIRIPRHLIASTQTLSGFLSLHSVKKDDKDTVITNTRIGDIKSGISGGKYHIPDEKYSEFLKLYYKDAVAPGKNEYLTEKQLVNVGPILVDLDLKFEYSVKRRLYTKEHVFDLICLYLEELGKMYQFDETETIPVFIFEKDTVNPVEDKNYTKDGIHMIIGLQTPHAVQCLLRTRVLERIADIWTDLPITNSWDDVFDAGISKGGTNWQLYGSRKPGNDAYKLKYVYNCLKNESDDNVKISEIFDISVFNNGSEFFKLSARYPSHPALFMTSEFVSEYEANIAKEGTGVRHVNAAASTFISESFASPGAFSLNDILNVQTKEELEAARVKFVASIPPTKTVIHESYQYTMSLPASYYSTGSFSKWLRVGWALRNTSNDLFIVWVLFSEQSSEFSYASIRHDLYTRWLTFDINNPNGKTVRSLMHWSKEDAPDKYKNIRDNSIDFFIEETLDELTVKNMNYSAKVRGKGIGHHDLATVLHQMYKDDYVCGSVKHKMWWWYKNHRWSESDSGTSLRRELSESMANLYRKKIHDLSSKYLVGGGDISNDKAPELMRITSILNIVKRLSNSGEKNSIMSEAMEEFYVEKFNDKLDKNPHLLCFNNGVIDFKDKVFRQGRPEDYITKCTNTNYRKLDAVRDKETIAEVNDFMEKLFPNKDLLKYMWEHLASTFIGTTNEQTINMYIGGGQNGKSMLVNLMEKCLGDYKGDVPMTLMSGGRVPLGGTSSEIAQLQGCRYAVIQEPSKGEKINEGIMKQLTGGDPIQARALYKDAVSFIPQMKLVMCSNVFPGINSNDHGTWRRIRIVDFESKFVDNPVLDDPDSPYQYPLDRCIKDKFDTWQPVFTAMLVEIAFQTGGAVKDCAKVLSSSNSYRNSQDYFAEFISDKIEASHNGALPKNIAVNMFKDWYNANHGSKHSSPKDVIAYIDKKFGKNRNGIWVGIRIRDDSPVGNYFDEAELSSDITDIDFSEV